MISSTSHGHGRRAWVQSCAKLGTKVSTREALGSILELDSAAFKHMLIMKVAWLRLDETL